MPPDLAGQVGVLGGRDDLLRVPGEDDVSALIILVQDGFDPLARDLRAGVDVGDDVEVAGLASGNLGKSVLTADNWPSVHWKRDGPTYSLTTRNPPGVSARDTVWSTISSGAK